MSKVKRGRFWMVWSPQGRASVIKHWSRELADKEATRLATVNPEKDFFVLKAVGGFIGDAKVRPLKVAAKMDPDEIIPF